MADLKQALQYASQNPTSDFAKQLTERIKSGQADVEAQQLGINLTPIKQSTPQDLGQPKEATKKTFMEKVAGFFGGEKIAQGLGQAAANPQIAKQQEQNFSEAIKQQGELLKRKKEIQSLGGDTTAIDKGLAYNQQNLNDIAGGLEGLLNQKGLTKKQVIGDALQLGTTVLGAGQIPGLAEGAVSATGIKAGLVQGAKSGALAGSVYGASSGISGSLKEDKSISDVALGGLTGAAEGAVTGAALGGIAGGISGGLKQRAINKVTNERNFALDLVSPKATEAVKQQALKEGRVTEQGLLSAGKITPSSRDLQLAKAVEGVVSKDKSAIGNINALNKQIGEINTGVKAYVAENKVPFNTNQLVSQLNKGKDELKLVFASDKQAEKTYKAVVDEFVKYVKNKDTKGLLDARQAFDKIPAIQKLLDSQGLAENVKKEVVLTARGQANKYISSLLPQGNKYREALLRESHMIEALGNIADKNTGIIGTNGLQALTKKYPVLKAVIGGAAAGLGLGAVGLGSSIIGSSE